MTRCDTHNRTASAVRGSASSNSSLVAIAVSRLLSFSVALWKVGPVSWEGKSNYSRDISHDKNFERVWKEA